MVRFIGYAMFAISVFSAYVAWRLGWVMVKMAEADLFRPGARIELALVVFCGVVLPLGIGALILKKNPAS